MKLQNGFSLMELMVVVAIVGIISAVAFPSYGAYMKKSRRTQARTDLMLLANLAERAYSGNQNYSYICSLNSAGLASAAGGGASDVYTYTVLSSSGTSATSGETSCSGASPQFYELRATPKTTGAQKNDGIIVLDSKSRRYWDINNDADFADSGENSW